MIDGAMEIGGNINGGFLAISELQIRGFFKTDRIFMEIFFWWKRMIKNVENIRIKIGLGFD